MRSFLLKSLPVLACLPLWGCDSPTDPLPEEIFLQGDLEPMGQAAHDVVLDGDGLVEFELVQWQAESLETGAVIDLPSALGFAIGTRPPPGSDPDLICVGSAAAFLTVANPIVLLLERTNFCVFLFDTTGIPPNSIATYSLRVRSTD